MSGRRIEVQGRRGQYRRHERGGHVCCYGGRGAPRPRPRYSAPSITGTAVQGDVLTEHHGTWTNSPTSYTYQWLRCDSTGANCTAIAGATAQTYTLTAADVGGQLIVGEAASNGAISGTAYSALSSVILSPALVVPVPVNSAPPTVSGLMQEGQTLVESHGTWSDNPGTFSYQWQRCDGRAVRGDPRGKQSDLYLDRIRRWTGHCGGRDGGEYRRRRRGGRVDTYLGDHRQQLDHARGRAELGGDEPDRDAGGNGHLRVRQRRAGWVGDLLERRRPDRAAAPARTSTRATRASRPSARRRSEPAPTS